MEWVAWALRDALCSSELVRGAKPLVAQRTVVQRLGDQAARSANDVEM
jgi:hypothetical protein